MTVSAKMRRKRVLIPICVIVAIVLVIVFTPYPASYLMRALFSNPDNTPPADYAQIEERVEVLSDITYPSLYQKNTVDIYLPKQASGDRPVILWAHGGGYIGGDKTDIKYYATALASQGYVVVSMNYSLAPESKYPVPLYQVADVCNWLESVQDEYSIDMKRLVLAGDSAGAHLMVQFALIQTSTEYADLCGLQASVDASSLRGLLLYCGPYNAPEIGDIKGFLGFMLKRAAWAYYGTPGWIEKYGDQISVTQHITKDFPPSFITDSNTMSFMDHGEKLADALAQENVPVETYFMSADEAKTIHEYQFKMNTPAGQECYVRTINFLNSI